MMLFFLKKSIFFPFSEKKTLNLFLFWENLNLSLFLKNNLVCSFFAKIYICPFSGKIFICSIFAKIYLQELLELNLATRISTSMRFKMIIKNSQYEI